MSCRAAALPEALPEALLILVQQECCLREQGVVCRLLATSKSLHSFILAKCIGRVHVALAREPDCHWHSDERVMSCRSWLAKYGCLMHSLLWHPWSDWVKDGKQMAELLAAAAATPQGLHLRSLDATAWETKELPLALQQLPAATLTRLAFVMRGEEPDGSEFDGMPIFSEEDMWEIEDIIMEQSLAVPNHDTEATAAALKSFTRLESLELISHGMNLDGRTSHLLQVLPQLTSLTKLTLKYLFRNTIDFQDRLPPQLQELELIQIFSRSLGERQPLALGHLTALTRLHTNSYEFYVAAHDVLPPNLHTLCVNTAASVKPLLPLTGLRKLTINRLPGVADIAAAITAAGHGTSDDKASERAAAPPVGEATPDGAPAGGSFDDRVAQLQLLLPGVSVKQYRRGTEVGCWCSNG